MDLNERQHRFTLEYAVGGNAAKAAKAAGYSPKCARDAGSRLLTVPAVQARIKELRAMKEASAYAILKGSQAQLATRLLELSKSPDETIALGACKEGLKDVLAERKELIGKHEITHRTMTDVLSETKALLAQLESLAQQKLARSSDSQSVDRPSVIADAQTLVGPTPEEARGGTDPIAVPAT